MRDFREGCTEEIANDCPPESGDWSFANLYADCAGAMNANARLKGRGYPRGCSALEAEAISIVRWAKYRAERIDEFNREQARKTKANE